MGTLLVFQVPEIVWLGHWLDHVTGFQFMDQKNVLVRSAKMKHHVSAQEFIERET